MGHRYLSVESCDRFCIYEVEQPPWMLRCLQVGVAAKSARPCGTHIEERVTLKSTIALLVLCSPAAIRGPQGGGCTARFEASFARYPASQQSCSREGMHPDLSLILLRSNAVPQFTTVRGLSQCPLLCAVAASPRSLQCS